VPFQYAAPASSPELRQGELLRNVWEHRSVQTSPATPEVPPQVLAVYHEVVVVLTADCDLLQDYNDRPSADPSSSPEDPNSHRLLAHVLLCDAYDGAPLKVRFQQSRLWSRVEKNQDERYHHLDAATVGDEIQGATTIPDLYLDFKKAFGLSPESIYEGIRTGHVVRLAVIPPIYLHHLMHRFYGFLSRVALPD
jgi:hypothetical protein